MLLQLGSSATVVQPTEGQQQDAAHGQQCYKHLCGVAVPEHQQQQSNEGPSK
jgi:hypothetical protein